MSLKIASQEMNPCNLPEDFHAITTDNDFIPGGDGLFGKQNVASPDRRCESEAARKIDQSIDYMRHHLDKPLQAPMLAALVNISPSHYFALFKHHTGCAPIDYFTRLRMHCARRLLDSTSSSVKEIADALGYSDPFYFSRVFKSINQVAPSKYRTQLKNSQTGAGRDDTGNLFFKTPKTANNFSNPRLRAQTRASIFSSTNTEKREI